MSKVIATDKHDAHIQYMRESVDGRHGVKYSFSPRKSVQHWSNTNHENDKTSNGDLWVTKNLVTEELRKEIEAVGVITDSPWLKGEYKIVLKDDTHFNRVQLFKKIIEYVNKTMK